MAINWTDIEGFREEMTAEERLALLEANEDYGVITADMKKSKAQFDKVSSELSAAKRQLKEKMTTDEREKAEREAADQALRDELAELRKEKTLNQYKSTLLAQGYDEASAGKMAESLVNGDMNSMFDTMKTARGDMEKRMRAEILRGTPKPPAGDDSTAKTPDILMAEKIGKTRADSMKTAKSIMDMYVTGGK